MITANAKTPRTRCPAVDSPGGVGMKAISNSKLTPITSHTGLDCVVRVEAAANFVEGWATTSDISNLSLDRRTHAIRQARRKRLGPTIPQLIQRRTNSSNSELCAKDFINAARSKDLRRSMLLLGQTHCGTTGTLA